MRAGTISFVQHMIADDFSTKNAGGVTFSEPHGSTAADMDGDGIPDFIVGKRLWSHHEGLHRSRSVRPAGVVRLPHASQSQSAGRGGVRARADSQPVGRRLADSGDGSEQGWRRRYRDLRRATAPSRFSASRAPPQHRAGVEPARSNRQHPRGNCLKQLTTVLLAGGVLLTGVLLVFEGVQAQTLRPPRQAPHTTWSDYGGGADQPRSTPHSSKSTARTSPALQVAWTYPTGDAANYLFNPLVVDDVMYVLAQEQLDRRARCRDGQGALGSREPARRASRTAA